MTAPATRQVMAAITSDGGEARFIGGCVRDLLLDIAVKDIDIATHEAPERVMELLAQAGIKAIPTGIEHGTVTAVVDDEHFEITTLRLDVETFGRRAEVAFTDDWMEDAARRDLTINALSLAADGTVHDPFGGVEDLRAGRIRFVGDAETRITEDVLRLLRFFRFFAYYGKPPADAEALAAAAKLAHLLPSLSGERVWGELMRLLLAPDVAAAFRLMGDHGVLAHILPFDLDFRLLQALAGVEAEVEVEAGIAGAARDPLRRLAALARLDRRQAEVLSQRLRLSRRQRMRLIDMATQQGEVPLGAGPKEAHRAIYRLGAALFTDLVFLDWAKDRAENPDTPRDADHSTLLELAKAWPKPELPIKGEDALELGLVPGPPVGAALARVEAWWIDEDFAPDRAACRQRLAAEIKEGGNGGEYSI
ncbi:MAG: CCA tRNA nucleotidyltransferase [Alphaproteobacteria bacterium]|nr:CCA tRNA nucleotidyltransferase [Alphaproteobacteria bacterium]